MYTREDNFNASDLVVIESLISALAMNIRSILGVDLHLVCKTDWTYTDIPTIEQMERIRSNAEKIAKVIQNDYTITTFGNKFNYKNANSLLDAIDFVFEWLWRMVSVIYFPQCGYYNSNEPLYLMAERN